MRNVKYAAIQMKCCNSVEENIKKADKMVREPLSILRKSLVNLMSSCQ